MLDSYQLESALDPASPTLPFPLSSSFLAGVPCGFASSRHLTARQTAAVQCSAASGGGVECERDGRARVGAASGRCGRGVAVRPAGCQAVRSVCLTHRRRRETAEGTGGTRPAPPRSYHSSPRQQPPDCHCRLRKRTTTRTARHRPLRARVAAVKRAQGARSSVPGRRTSRRTSAARRTRTTGRTAAHKTRRTRLPAMTTTARTLLTARTSAV